MSRPLFHRIAGLAALASLPALLLGGTALAQVAGSVQMFEEPPPLELLRSIMVPKAASGLTRRIVITQPYRPASMIAEAATESEPSAEWAPAATPRRARWQPPATEAGPVLATAQVPAPAPRTEPRRIVAEPLPAAAPGSVGFRINFALNSDVVPQGAVAFVERIAELLREQPQVKLRIEGHTDALGSDVYNLELSQRRAAAVASHLVTRQGIDATRLVVLGLGEGVPLTANALDPRNRRVQFARVE